MGIMSDRGFADDTTSRRIGAIQRWLANKASELRGSGFYGELSVTLKFEDGQCVLGEQSVKEKTK